MAAKKKAGKSKSKNADGVVTGSLFRLPRGLQKERERAESRRRTRKARKKR